MPIKRIEDLPYEEIWCFDTEISGGDSGGHYEVVCLAARELRSGRTIRLWCDELGPEPPYRIDDRVLFVCFVASAECGSHLSLLWPMPARVLDLSPEYRNTFNGRISPKKINGIAPFSLVGALTKFGLPTLPPKVKEAWQARIIEGPPWTAAERAGILEYCGTDVDGAVALLECLLPTIDLDRALLRGEFVKASTLMQWRGVPIDMEIFSQLRDEATWDQIRERLIPPVDAAYGVYEGRVFKIAKFEAYLARYKIPWPRLESGQLDLDADTFRDQAKAYTQVAPLHELRHTLGKLRRIKLQVGVDGRNRTVLWPFAAKTGRTQPSNSEYIFGPSVWLRSLIRPGPGQAVAYVDWSAMEFGIAAALSGDPEMIKSYQSGDPYLSFAISFGAAPPEATKHTHHDVRELYKVMLLAAQYGMGAHTLAGRLGVSTVEAAEMLQHHRLLYAQYWRWSDQWLHRAMSVGQMHTCYGWEFYLDLPADERTVRNWPI